MSADSAVPVGERSILPGWIATAERARNSAPSRVSGPAKRQNEKWRQSGLVGCTKPRLSVAARVIRAPFFIDDARQAVAVRRHPNVASVVADFDRLTTAVVGIGAVVPTPISIAYSAVPDRVIERVVRSGAVGEVQG